MLIGNVVQKPSLEIVRRVKSTLLAALDLPDDSLITVNQLACLEAGCPPVETVIGLLRPATPPLQLKIHKPVDALKAEDLARVCEAWGLTTNFSVIEDFSKEN